MDTNSLSLEISFPDEKLPSAILQSIKPDYDKQFERRSSSSINSYKNVLKLEINAKDAVAMKASFNSYLKLISLLCNVQEGI